MGRKREEGLVEHEGLFKVRYYDENDKRVLVALRTTDGKTIPVARQNKALANDLAREAMSDVEAKRREARRVAQLRELGVEVAGKSSANPNGWTVGELMRRHYDHVLAQNAKGKRIEDTKHAKKILDRVLRDPLAAKPIDKVEGDDVLRFARRQKCRVYDKATQSYVDGDDDVSEQTQRNLIYAVSSAYEYAKALAEDKADGTKVRHYTGGNPVHGIPKREKPKASTPTPHPLSADMLAVLTAALGDDETPVYQRIAMAIGLYAGLRREEVITLQWCDVDVDAGMIFVRGAERENGERQDKGRNNGNLDAISVYYFPELAPFIALARAYCTAYVEDGRRAKYVLPSPRGEGEEKPMRSDAKTAEWVRGVFRRAGYDDAALEHVTFHALRDTYVTRVLDESGGNMRLAQEMARHKSLTTTERHYTGYTKAKHADLFKAKATTVVAEVVPLRRAKGE